jgi:tetratricopeptide (TPR) repeat protein
VLTRDSLYAYAWKEAGKLYAMAGMSASDKETREQRFKEAIGSYRRFLELAKDSADGEVFYNLGRSYYFLGGFAQADSAFEYLLTRGEQPLNIYLYLGRSKVGGQQYEAGITYLKQYLEGMKAKDSAWMPGQEEADIFRRIGDAYKKLQNTDSAGVYYSQAAVLEPQSAQLLLDYAITLHQQKDYAKALEFYQKRLDLGSETAEINLYAAYCALNLDSFPKAVEYLLKVVALDSMQLKAYALLSNTHLYNLQDCPNGVSWTRRWLEKEPDNCEALQNMGYAYFVGKGCANDYSKAVDYFTRALGCYKTKGSENCANAQVMLFIAQAYHLQAAALLDNKKKPEAKANFKNAYDWYNKVLKCEPANADAKKGIKDTEFEF